MVCQGSIRCINLPIIFLLCLILRPTFLYSKQFKTLQLTHRSLAKHNVASRFVVYYCDCAVVLLEVVTFLKLGKFPKE